MSVTELSPAAGHRGGGTESPSHGLRRAAAVAVVIGLVQLTLVLLFAWPASQSAPHDLPLGVAGPPPAAQAVSDGLTRSQPGAFAVSTYSDDATARAAVLDRQVYGALSLAPGGAVTLYVATSASPTVAAALERAVRAAVAAAVPGAEVTVTDLAPAPADDPHGVSLPVALIPLTITSLAAGVLLGLVARGRALRLGSLAAYAAVAGVLSTFALQTVLGGLDGRWWANAGVLALSCLAIAAAAAGLTTIAGRFGAALAVVVVFFLGFPFSGALTAWELVPTPWGQWAQALPVGATSTGLRAVAFFDGAGAGGSLRILATWAVVGLALAGLTRGRTGTADRVRPG